MTNVRKGIDGTWQLAYLEESFVVPSSPPYVYYLDEVPDDGTLVAPPAIEGLMLSSAYPPQAGWFWCNYRQGLLVFNEAQAGYSLTVAYYGKGSLVEAEEINYLAERLGGRIYFSDVVPPRDEVGLWCRTAPRGDLFFLPSPNGKWLSAAFATLVFSRSGHTYDMFLPAANVTSSSVGYYFPIDVTVSAIYGNRSSSGAASLVLYGENDELWTGVWSGRNFAYHPDVEVEAGSIVRLYHNGNSQNPLVFVLVREVV